MMPARLFRPLWRWLLSLFGVRRKFVPAETITNVRGMRKTDGAGYQ